MRPKQTPPSDINCTCALIHTRISPTRCFGAPNDKAPQSAQCSEYNFLLKQLCCVPNVSGQTRQLREDCYAYYAATAVPVHSGPYPRQVDFHPPFIRCAVPCKQVHHSRYTPTTHAPQATNQGLWGTDAQPSIAHSTS